MTERLTSLAAVKDWLQITTDESDKGLTRLIDAASRFVINYLNRDGLAPQTYIQNSRGNGRNGMLLKNWPVLSVSSVGIAGRSLTASTFSNGLPTSGFYMSDARQAPQSLTLVGDSFPFGYPVSVSYVAGYRGEESFIIPHIADGETSARYEPSSFGSWTSDEGVTVEGVVFTRAAEEDPEEGEYWVSEWGVYHFNVADVEKDAIISYGYTPWDIDQAVAELIGEWYKKRDRIGIVSKTLGGQETVTFSQRDMGSTIKTALQGYKNEVPI